jgi:hypothetical protein
MLDSIPEYETAASTRNASPDHDLQVRTIFWFLNFNLVEYTRACMIFDIALRQCINIFSCLKEHILCSLVSYFLI